MPYGLYISAEGAHAQSERLKVVANNLANVDTTAFKRDVMVFKARYTEAVQQGLDQQGSGSPDDLSGGVVVTGVATDLSQGTLKYTGRDTDLAIDGEGYFVIQRGKQPLLTRAGNFSVNPNGNLVTQSGDCVLTDAGIPVVIDPDLGPWAITSDGAFQQAGNLQPLAMVIPRHHSDLAKIGDNLFMPLDKTDPLQPGDRRLTVGFLEGSGVRPTLEMMEMIEATRAFEANTRMIQNQDQMMGTLISRVLKDS